MSGYRSPVARFNEKYHVDDRGCWIWTSAKSGGYGHFYLNGEVEKAHRASYRLFKGEIPAGLVVRHACDRPVCVNPAHLEVGRVADNVNDTLIRGRNIRGSMSHFAKLSPREVRVIRKLYSTDHFFQYELSSLFEVSQQHISRIVNGKKWKEII